jgi:hypothetical protein
VRKRMGLLSKFIKKGYKDSDNRGIIQSTVEDATNFWVRRNKLKKFEPFLLYEFDDEADAVRSLLNIRCIKIAEDTEQLICTENLNYGYYPLEGGKFEVILCGSSLDDKLFSQAEKSFILNNGRLINSKKPPESEKIPAPFKLKNFKKEAEAAPVEAKPEPRPPEVEFVKEENVVKREKPYTFRIYKAKTESDAVRFLLTKIVSQKSLVLIVKTPKGSFGRNYSGIFKPGKKT